MTVSMRWCQRTDSCQPVGTREANQSCEGVISGTQTADLFVQGLESQMERHEVCSLKMQERKAKGENQVKPWEVFMQPGEKLNLTRSIRSAKTGSGLPKEGTLVSVTENLGRTLLLVEFHGDTANTFSRTR